MPATAQLEIPEARSHSTVPARKRQFFFRCVDPLAGWRNSFVEWREEIKEFRDAEQTLFFAKPNSQTWQRQHRGWLCSLISDGEILALKLIEAQQERNAAKEFELLNLCLENLRATLDTWHSTLEIEQEAKG